MNAQDVQNIGKQEPFKISGSIGVRGTYFAAEGRASNRVPFGGSIYGNPTISIYGIDIPFSFIYSEQQRDFRQPFNQFGLSPKYKWITAHLGHRNIKWSDYSLAGHNAFGAGLELTPGNFRISFMKGRFLKPIEVSSDPGGSYQTPSFKRVGSALKLGYGTQKNSFDIVVFRAKDRINSIENTNLPATLTPSENLVTSIITHHLFFEKLFFDAEYARSIFTPNTANPDTHLLNDTFSNFFSFLINEKFGTRIGDAIKATLGFKEKTFDIKLKYNRIDPLFKSLGAYFFLTDIEKITITPRVKIAKNKLVVGGSFGVQKDNLSKTKNAHTKRNIYALNINFSPTQKYNLNVNYSNYGITQKPGTKPINNQVEIAQINQQLTMIQNVNLINKNKTNMHMIMLLWNYQRLADDNSMTAQFSEFKSNIISPRYTFSHLTKQFTMGIGYNYNIFSFSTRATKNYGPSVTISKAFKKLNLTAAFNYYDIENNGVIDKTAFTVSFTAKYKVEKKHQFTFRAHINNGNVTGINPLNYSETKIDFGYAYTF